MAIKAFEGCLLAVGMWHNHQTARKLKEMKKLLHFAFPINQDQGVGREEICERFPQLESPWSTPSASWERILLQCAAKDFLHHQRCFPNHQYFCDVTSGCFHRDLLLTTIHDWPKLTGCKITVFKVQVCFFAFSQNRTWKHCWVGRENWNVEIFPSAESRINRSGPTLCCCRKLKIELLSRRRLLCWFYGCPPDLQSMEI